MTAPRAELGEEKLARIWRDQIRDDVFLAPAPSAQPLTVLLGGQPGAGKTAAGQRVEQAHPGESISPIIGDELRAYHPDFDAVLTHEPLAMADVTAQASGRWIGMSVDHANEERYSILIEGTWRTPSVPLEGARLAKQHGRRTHAVVVAVPAEVSRLSTLERYYRDADAGLPARWTPPHAHDVAAATLPEVVEQVAASAYVDRFTVTDRSGAVLFDHEGDAGPERGRAAARAFRAAFDRPLSAGERADVRRIVPAIVAAHERHTGDRIDARALADWALALRDRAVVAEVAASAGVPSPAPDAATPYEATERRRPRQQARGSDRDQLGR